jgi:nicotinate phosphoribosyltransferase
MPYAPSTDLLQGIRSLFPIEICPWDDYFPRMAQTDWLEGKDQLKGSKTFFIRKAPFNGSYAVMGGLTSFIRTIHDFRFDEIVSTAMLDMGYKRQFVDFLSKVQERINVNVYSIPEGEFFFPNEPAIILEGNLLDLRFAEGILLKHVNFPSLSFTKWSRVAQAASPGASMEFARRRAQDDIRTSVYAHLAGINFSSNAEVRRGLDVKIVGTMGHEFIQSRGNQFDAFDSWLEYNPDKPVLLGDTEDTLKSGLPDAIKAFNKHWERILNAGGVPGFRLDSGDLAYLTIECRKGFDEANLNAVRIFETNDLDEYSIQRIKEQIYTHAHKAGLDPFETIEKIIWACGTQPGTCSDQPSLGGVAKLTSIEYNGHECEVIKLAKDNPVKTSIPGNNRSALVINKDTGTIYSCLIYKKEEDPKTCRIIIHPDDEYKNIIIDDKYVVVERQKQVYFNHMIEMETDITAIKKVHQRALSELHWTSKRFENPHTIKVGLSPALFHIRRDMIKNNMLINAYI